MAGVAGNGQRELGDLILGARALRPWSEAAVGPGGDPMVGRADPRPRGGVRPRGRLRDGGRGEPDTLENMALGNVGAYARAGGLAMDWRARRRPRRSLARLGVTLPPPEARAGALSGGNVQRAILAREMARDPRLIVALYPTRGLDVKRSTAADASRVLEATTGAGVLLISEDLDELRGARRSAAALVRADRRPARRRGHLRRGGIETPATGAARGVRGCAAAASAGRSSWAWPCSRSCSRVRQEPAQGLRRHLLEHARRRTASPRRWSR